MQVVRENKGKMYKIEVPATIHKAIVMFYRLGLWSIENENTFRDTARKLFYFFYYISFVISNALGAHLTDDKDESISLIVTTTTAIVLTYKLWLILWKKNELLKFVEEVGTHYTDDQKEFVQVNYKLKMLMKFAQYFILMVAAAVGYITLVFPVITKRLFFNIAFPLDWSNSQFAFWMVCIYAALGFFVTAIGSLFTTILWYLMLSFVFKYDVLGNQFKNIGVFSESHQPSVSSRKHPTLYGKDFIESIKNYKKINGYTTVDSLQSENR